MKVYLDSVIWIDYAWGLYNHSEKIKYKSKKIIEEIKERDIEVVYSLFSNAEVSAHFRDWILLQKVIKDGYSHREFSRVKKNYKLTKLNKEKIEKLTQQIFDQPWVMYVDMKMMSEEHFEAFKTLTWTYQIDSIDALHNIVAREKRCDYLITNDEDMRSGMKQFLSDINDQQYAVIRPEEFINLLDKKPC